MFDLTQTTICNSIKIKNSSIQLPVGFFLTAVFVSNLKSASLPLDVCIMEGVDETERAVELDDWQTMVSLEDAETLPPREADRDEDGRG